MKKIFKLKYKYYGQTFLTKRRFHTSDEAKAEKSLFKYGYDWRTKQYFTSYLGILNGFLEKVGLVLEVEREKVGRQLIIGTKLKKVGK